MKDKKSMIKLCYNPEYTIADYEDDWSKKNKKGVSQFIYNRFYERFIKPFEGNMGKNGFVMMAVSCLMIESFECFNQGLNKTPKWKGKQFFKNFIDNCNELSEFKGLCGEFYEHIRNGILHQAETTGGWILRRDGDLVNIQTKTINATEFLKRLEQYLKRYKEELEKEEINSLKWVNFNNKMQAIITNCLV